MRMRALLLSVVAALLFTAPAFASDESDALSLVQKWIDSFNKNDAKAVTAVCTKDAIILDDFPPHIWQGPNTCARWFQDFQAFAAKSDITEPAVSLEKAQHVDITSDVAYVVIPTTFTFKKSGKPVKETGIVTLKLHKTSTGWLIAGWAWADQQ
jgi:ketosteroid isomerase-like protein